MQVDRAKLFGALRLALIGSHKSKDEAGNFATVTFDRGSVWAYNGEVFCRAATGVDFGSRFSVAVESVSAVDSVVKGDVVDVVVDGSSMKFKDGGRRVSAKVVESSQEPPVGSFEGFCWEDAQEDIAEAVGMCSGCVSDKADNVLSCVHFHPKWTEASDGFELVRHRAVVPAKSPTLLSGRVASRFLSFLPADQVAVSDEWVLGRSEVGVIACRVSMCGTYPEATSHLKVAGDDIAFTPSAVEACKSASVVAGEGAVVVEVKGKKIRLSAEGKAGTFVDVMGVEYEGPDRKFSMASKLLVKVVSMPGRKILSDSKIKVSSDRWSFVACLGIVEG